MIRVVEFINRTGALDTFYEHIDPLLDYLLPQYCGGQGPPGGGDRLHRRPSRSVAIAEHLAERYRGNGGYLVDVLHRDVAEPA